MPSSNQKLNVVVGISGGIAAFKAVGVVRELVLLGHNVQVVATESALKFVGAPTLEALSRNPVYHDLFEGVAEVRHVAIGQSADVIVIAPATANMIARLSVGLADDLVSTTVLASKAPLVIAPAMHTEMWQHASTQHNIRVLEERGVTIVGPATGQLTGNDSGPGRMAEPTEIALATVEAHSRKINRHDLAGRHVLITAGGTREPIDPVRFIGNRSTGKQGVALASAAALRGAMVTLIGANLEVSPPAGVELVAVGTAIELQAAVELRAPKSDLIIMAAAVADYRPQEVSDSKIKKDVHGEQLQLSLVRNPDILAALASSARPSQVVVGFAAETETDEVKLLETATLKLERKGCDFLVVNKVGWTEGFASESNAITVLAKGGDIVLTTSGTKLSVADSILDLLI
ncbi:MAG: bifunctional phosphopantothenoylcysteine decarboxylase/phosphopantothenate--cysteine ligase CoaBC [Microbacteriaceae bacterium]|nr:bifunctional phosphopantothenoylcysteine decarboxylase/phosphopantothenate--cysteine ligase CoaBC [Microbacteriaceae bacterium]